MLQLFCGNKQHKPLNGCDEVLDRLVLLGDIAHGGTFIPVELVGDSGSDWLMKMLNPLRPETTPTSLVS